MHQQGQPEEANCTRGLTDLVQPSMQVHSARCGNHEIASQRVVQLHRRKTPQLDVEIAAPVRKSTATVVWGFRNTNIKKLGEPSF